MATTNNNPNISVTYKSNDGCENMQNTGFMDDQQTTVTTINSNPDASFARADAHLSSLSDFLSRPIKIQEFSWLVNTSLTQTFSPWSDYFSNAAVQKKIDNFYLLRCKLNVMFKMNASPFLYGSALAAYAPYDTHSTVEMPTVNKLTTLSQRPSAYIDVGTNITECMCLPFFCKQSNLRIPETTDFSEMGTMTLDSFVDLKSANGGTGNITISVYAWASEVEMSIPTTGSSFTPQGAIDEHEDDGVVSKPASAISAAAGKLTKIPAIAPFARAAQIGASAIADVARLFGFSRPVNLKEPNFMRPYNFGNLASTDMGEPIFKLTVDSKQGLSIDPRTVGLDDVDEMSIKYIAQRESYVNSFSWLLTDAPDAYILSTAVNPMIQNSEAWTGPPASTIYVPTALSFATRPFSAWTGTLKFRFRIVASQYHRGRLRVVYDPHRYQGVDTGFAEDISNIVFNKVVDIATTRDFTIEVPWSQPWAYNDVETTDNSAMYNAGGATAIPLRGTTSTNNGWLGIQVLNELIGPSNSGDVSVLMYVSAGDDYKVRNPTFEGMAITEANTLSYYKPQGALDDEVSGGTDGIDTEVIMVNPSTSKGSNYLDQVFYGESIDSFRSMVKRYTWYYSVAKTFTASSTVGRVFSLVLPLFPRCYGFGPSVDVFSAKEVILTGQHMLGYLRPAYVGWRGGMRYKYSISGVGTVAQVGLARGVDQAIGTTYTADMTNTSTVTSSLQYLRFFNSTALGGMVLSNTSTMPVVEAEFPYQTFWRFSFCQNLDAAKLGDSEDGTDTMGVKFFMRNDSTASSSNPIVNDLYVAAGDDFNFFFFLNAPCYFRYLIS